MVREGDESVMAGGNFDINQPKVRPGNYINFKAKQKVKLSTSTRGTCVIPLVGYDWGPDGEFITLSSDTPDAEAAKLGRSIYSDNDSTRLIRLAFDNAITVHVYIISDGKKAQKKEGNLMMTARYGGARGNNITVTSTANVDGGFDLTVYLDGELMESYNGVTTVEQLTEYESEYVEFSGSGEITAFAGAILEGGENKEVTNKAFTDFLDKVEKIKCNTVLIPVSDEALVNAAASKVKYLRNRIGKTVQFVFAGFAGDDIGIINVVNSFRKYNTDLSIVQAAAWVTGATAGADKTTSNTYKVVENATAVVGEMAGEEAEAAILAGKFFFSTSDDTGEVIVEYDINSLVHPTEDQDDSYKKNRVIRVLDSFADDLKATIKPNQFNNEPKGWEKMKQFGRLLLARYSNMDGGDGAIKNVDLENDFVIDTTRSEGDSTYFEVGLQPVDSSEKLYFSIFTQ